MHDTLFEHQSALGTGFLVEYASDLGLDMSRFLQDMASHVSAERVGADIVSRTQSGVQTTPTFFVNGVRQRGSWTESASWGQELAGTQHRGSATDDRNEEN